jgi:hypothetical protein
MNHHQSVLFTEYDIKLLCLAAYFLLFMIQKNSARCVRIKLYFAISLNYKNNVIIARNVNNVTIIQRLIVKFVLGCLHVGRRFSFNAGMCLINSPLTAVVPGACLVYPGTGVMK